MKSIFRLFLIGSLLCISTKGEPGQADPQTIVSEAEKAVRFSNAKGKMKMEISTDRWTRNIKFEFWYKNGNQAKIFIMEPPKERGTVSLKNGDQMWNYFPDSGQVIRVHPSMLFNSWMGSDLTNDDLVHGVDFSKDFESKIVGARGDYSDTNYIIELIPKDNSPVIWSKVVYHISRTMIPVRQEYFDQMGKLARTIIFSEVKTIDGKQIPTRWTVNREGHPGGTTILLFQVDLHAQIPDPVFYVTSLGK
jgi:outer membrane lipoprotein-sorting protein